MTMVIKCSCKSTFQDGRYGNGMRVHNPTVKEPKGSNWRCTICNKENSKSGPK